MVFFIRLFGKVILWVLGCIIFVCIVIYFWSIESILCYYMILVLRIFFECGLRIEGFIVFVLVDVV